MRTKHAGSSSGWAGATRGEPWDGRSPALARAGWHARLLHVSTVPKPSRGPFRANQIRCGDPYELSDGHAIYVLPAGGRHADTNLVGGQVLATDPDVTQAGMDAGYSPEPGTLRAPDIAVGNVPREPGWIQGVPPLAVEYVDTGQDEAELRAKVDDLLRWGTKY